MGTHEAALQRRLVPVDFKSTFLQDIEEVRPIPLLTVPSFTLRRPPFHVPARSLLQDDPDNCNFKAQSEVDLNQRFLQWRPYHMLLILRWCKKYMLNSMRLPRAPTDTAAAHALSANSLEGRFRAWLFEHFERTDPKDYNPHGVLPIADLVAHHRVSEGPVRNLDIVELKYLLDICEVPVRTVKNMQMNRRNMVNLRRISGDDDEVGPGEGDDQAPGTTGGVCVPHT